MLRTGRKGWRNRRMRGQVVVPSHLRHRTEEWKVRALRQDGSLTKAKYFGADHVRSTLRRVRWWNCSRSSLLAAQVRRESHFHRSLCTPPRGQRNREDFKFESHQRSTFKSRSSAGAPFTWRQSQGRVERYRRCSRGCEYVLK